MRLSALLYHAARVSRDIGAIKSGKPKRMVRRAKNKITGRELARVGVFRRLWR